METKYKVGIGVGVAGLGILAINQRRKVLAAAKAAGSTAVAATDKALNIQPAGAQTAQTLAVAQQPNATPAQNAAGEAALAAIVVSAAAANNITVDQLEQLANNAPTADTARTFVLNAINAAPGVDPAVAAAKAVANLIAASGGGGGVQAQINPNTVPQLAIVQTNDPAPAGDLRVFDAPNGSQIGGVDKGGTVSVDITFNDPTFASIQWPGGRNPAVNGFVHKAFLRLV